MRKFTASCIDNKTKMEMVYSECSLNEALFQLEIADGLEIIDIHNISKYIEEKPFIIIETKNRVFWYDKERKYLLGE